MLSSEFNETLKSSQPFRHLESHELNRLMTYCEVVTFSDGETIIQQGKLSKGMYIILEGNALVTAKVLGRDTLKLATMTRGSFIGEVSMIEKALCTITVIANEQVKCLLVSSNYFDMLTLFFPEIRYKISKAITEEVCHRIKDTRTKITELISNIDMTTLSLFNEVIQSLTKPTNINFDDARINLKHLKNQSFFNLLNENEYEELLKESTLIDCPPQCSLIKEHDENTSYFIVLRGAVLSSINKNKKTAKLSVLSPVSLLCSLSHIDGAPAVINYSTCEHALLLKITPSHLNHIQKENIQLWYKIYDFICTSFLSLERSTSKLYIRLNSELYNR
jgi:CRP/FNR family cyclic AMP-dependent transcriptional regulator